ncbi:MAG: hypothetical protein AB7J40_02700, partial [Candidatus Altimarinota bacterium]
FPTRRSSDLSNSSGSGKSICGAKADGAKRKLSKSEVKSVRKIIDKNKKVTKDHSQRKQASGLKVHFLQILQHPLSKEEMINFSNQM